jgi:hypothetical protein
VIGAGGRQPAVEVEHPFDEADHPVVFFPIAGVRGVDGVDWDLRNIHRSALEVSPLLRRCDGMEEEVGNFGIRNPEKTRSPRGIIEFYHSRSNPNYRKGTRRF